MAKQAHAISHGPAVETAAAPRYGDVQIRNRGRLPHWEMEEGLYFITFDLADALPAQALHGMMERQRAFLAAENSRAHMLPGQKVLAAKYNQKEIQAYIDRGAGESVFKDPRIAEAMATALRFGHGNRYRLIAWCVMPNHVHVVCRLLPGQRLSDVVKSWKVYSAREANRILGRSGALWRREYYDRLIRREGELDRAVRYVLSNPQMAGLKHWAWVWSEGQEALGTAGQETGGT